jgi:hypothetical protein
MLSKVTKDNYILGTNQIIKYANQKNNYDIIIDNLEGYLLIKDNYNIFYYNYYKNIIIKNVIRIRLNILDKYFWKQVYSFDQNNIKIANKIRSFVIKYFSDSDIYNTIGIGGEYYIYFPFIKSNNYIGISNHQSIIDDADFNLKFYNLNYKNYIVNYNDILSFPQIDNNISNVIINVSNIHENHIKWITNYNINKLVIITCTPVYKKMLLITKYFIIKKIKYFLNFNSWVTILFCIRKPIIKYISLGSNCSVTYQLNKYNLRMDSYPFDWTKISITQIINVLNNNFNSYINIQIKKLSELHLNKYCEPTLILKNNYGIIFAHELTNDMCCYIKEFRKKLSKRIDRFINLSNDKVKFIRIELSNINKQYFELLNQLVMQLEKYVLNFELIVIINYNNDIPDNISKKIKIYKFDQFLSDWKMNNLDWKKFLL